MSRRLQRAQMEGNFDKRREIAEERWPRRHVEEPVVATVVVGGLSGWWRFTKKQRPWGREMIAVT